MFPQSLTAKLLKGFADKFSESMFFCFICKFLKAAGKFIEKLYGLIQKSILFGIFFTITGALKKLYNGSGLKCYIDAKNFFNKPWSKSGLAHIADAIIHGLTYLAEKIGDFIKKLFCGSFILSVYDLAMEKWGFHRILAAVFGIMFLVYSSIWNNLYAAGICVILLFLLLYKNRRTVLSPSKIDFFMVLFLISLVLGVISAPGKGDAIRIALIAASALGFHLCTTVVLDDNRKIVDFIKIMSWVMALTALVAIYQRLSGIEVDPEFVDISVNAGMPGRVFSTMENPNNYAELLVLFMPFMYALILNEKGAKQKVMWIAVAGISAIALAMTYSRSCYVAFALATVIFVCVYDYRLLLPFAILCICAVPFLPQTILNRIMTIGSLQDSSNNYRLYIWDTCIQLVRNYGMSGLGIGPKAFSAYYRPIAYRNAATAPHSHMLYLELILEYGVLGFIGFMGYYVRIIRNGFKNVKLATKEERAYLGAGIGSLIGITFVSCAEYIWFYPRDMFAHLIVLGILAALARNIGKKDNNVSAL